jgi:predicted DNA-binding ribbon-helix-helix protein
MVDVRDDRDVADVHWRPEGLSGAVYTHGLCQPQDRLRRRAAAAKVRTVRKRSVTINGHRTSVSLEDAFWSELSSIADARGLSLNALVAEIDQARHAPGNLSSALRLYVLDELRRRTINRA